jgi:hypothetical protein
MSFFKKLLAVFKSEAEQRASGPLSPGEEIETNMKTALKYFERGEISLDRGQFEDAVASLT